MSIPAAFIAWIAPIAISSLFARTKSITDGDIRRAMESREKEFFSLKAKDLMSTDPKLIDVHEKLITASSMMSENKINSLLVVNTNNDFVGVVQMYDLGI